MRRSRAALFNLETQKLELLLTPLNQLHLPLEKSPYLAEAVHVVRDDMKRVGMNKLQPYFYVSTGYGTVAGTTSISLGFYDYDDVFRELNYETRGFVYTPEEVINTTRHELGHAFSYAYKLYRRPDFREVFKVKGNYFLTYPETERYIYRANPWSRDFVNPSGDHYAQKHPDDDFAETFLVWLLPNYDWRYEYRNYPGALRKLEFVEQVVEELRNTEPVIDQSPNNYEPLDSFKMTLAHFFKLRSTRAYRKQATGYIDPDLKDLFWRPAPYRGKRRRELDYVHADNFIRRHKHEIVKQASRWVGVDETVVKDLLDKCSARTHALDLWVKKTERDRKVVELTSYISYRCALYALNDSYL